MLLKDISEAIRKAFETLRPPVKTDGQPPKKKHTTSQSPRHSMANASTVVRRALSRSTLGRGNGKKPMVDKDSKDSRSKYKQTRTACLTGHGAAKEPRRGPPYYEEVF